MNLHKFKYVYKRRNINVLFSHFLTNQSKLDRQNFKVVLIDVIFYMLHLGHFLIFPVYTFCSSL